jgi:transposase
MTDKTAKTTPLVKGARITGKAKDKLTAEIAKKYNGGATIRELANEYGRSFGWMHRVLSEAEGVTLRGRGGATRGAKVKAKKLTPAQEREYAERLRERKVR